MLRGEHRQLAQDEQEAFLDQHADDALTRPAGVRSRAVYAMRNQCRGRVQLIEADDKLAASGAVLLAYGAHVARHTASVHSQPGLSPFAKVDPSTLISTVVRPRSASPPPAQLWSWMGCCCLMRSLQHGGLHRARW